MSDAKRGITLRPGASWRWARRLSQALAVTAVLFAPLLGGWQRLDSASLASFESSGTELPGVVGERLPEGRAPAAAHRVNRLLGGGVGVEYFSIPMVDPVAGGLALARGGYSGRTLLAFALPVVLGLLAGRVFCGWFCPFGWLSRSVDGALARVRFRAPLALPERRLLRWVLLGGAVFAGVGGVHTWLYLCLPHFLVQHTLYSAWLLGSGGAVLGVLLGLVAAGLLFGPTSYCASMCPTGAALSLLGRRRLARLTVAEPAACGRHCGLCASACWLQLDPSSGDPGPDCDLCTRCLEGCPRANLVVRVGGSAPRRLAVLPLLVAVLLPLLAAPTDAGARRERKPLLLLEAELEREGVDLGVAVLDLNGVKLGVDASQTLRGIEVSVHLARGERGPADARGLIPGREVYDGAVHVELVSADGRRLASHDLEEPNAPASALRRKLYRWRTDTALRAGDSVLVGPIEGWLPEATRFVVPRAGVELPAARQAAFALAALLVFGGLLSLAYAWPSR